MEPGFFRIYRVDTATDIVKSVPAGIDRVKNYQFRVAVPELNKLFDGTEQLVAVARYSPVRTTDIPSIREAKKTHRYGYLQVNGNI